MQSLYPQVNSSFSACCHVSAFNERIKALMYLFSNSGLSYIDKILEMGLFFCSFDFAGCGNSEGDKISFGANEKYDIDTVIEHIVK